MNAQTLSLAERVLGENRFADAATLFEQALASDPGNANAWYNLAYTRRMQLDPMAALAAYDRALAAGVTQAELVHLNKAAIFSDLLQNVAAARASLGEAIAIDPVLALAWLNLGQIEEDLGNAEAARTAYNAVLRDNPGQGRALARLAAIDIFEGHPEVALQRLAGAEAAVENTVDLFEVEFAAAAALDAAGDYDAAFERANNANAWQQRFSSLRYSPAAQSAQVDALISLFPAVSPHPPVTSDAARLRPIFICGLFRSGSTLVEALLARRLGITMGGELAYTPWFVSENGSWLSSATLDTQVDTFRRGYTEFSRTVLGDVDRFTDKRMDNFLYIGLIKRAFPDALIVHTIRNPIDNFLSMYFLPFADSLTYTNDLDDMLHFYREYRRLMAHWQACYGDDIITVRYDDLVADPDMALAALANRLGVETAVAPLADEQIIRTASVWQVRQPVHRRSSGRWRHYAAHIGELAAQLEAEFPEFQR